MKLPNSIKQFDDFDFHARIMPAATVLFPFFVHLFLNGWSSVTAAGTLFILVFAVFSGQIINVLGKEYEISLKKRMKGLASTIILRFSNSKIDSKSKAHYHQIINEKLGITLPLSLEEERKDPDGSDQAYTFAMNELRIYANNHRKKVPRVYQELKKYTYWRNLRGCKWVALSLYAIMIIIEVIRLDSLCFFLAVRNPNTHHHSILVFFLWGVLFMVVSR